VKGLTPVSVLLVFRWRQNPLFSKNHPGLLNSELLICTKLRISCYCCFTENSS
jgi:hypothetical protein